MLICLTLILVWYLLFGEYYWYWLIMRWPYVAFYRDNVVLAFLSGVMGTHIVRSMFVGSISAVQHILEGFLTFDRDVHDRLGGFDPDDISPAARRFLSAYEEGGIIFRLMRAMRYTRWAAFLTILWIYADTAVVNRVAYEIAEFGSASSTGYAPGLSISLAGYALGLLLFIILWVFFFIVQGVTIGFSDRRLQKWFGDATVDEAMQYVEKRAAAGGYLPLMKRSPWVSEAFTDLHARRSQE
jgi:hypothetical protein